MKYWDVYRLNLHLEAGDSNSERKLVSVKCFKSRYSINSGGPLVVWNENAKPLTNQTRFITRSTKQNASNFYP